MNIDTNIRAGQYVGLSGDLTRRHALGDLRIILYGAYDAFGLIGPEHNGVAVLCESPKRCVILDGHYQEGTGYFGPSQRQRAEFARIVALDDAALESFIRAHPRNRFTGGNA